MSDDYNPADHYNAALHESYPRPVDSDGNDLPFMNLSDRINDAENKTSVANFTKPENYEPMVKGLIRKGFSEKRLK